MKNLRKIVAVTSLFTLALFLCATPVLAQSDSLDGAKAEKSSTAGASVAQAEGAAMEWANCELCKSTFEDMELIMACDYNVSNWSGGLMTVINLKKPELMERLRAFEKKSMAGHEKYLNGSPKACAEELCSHCNTYFAFIRNGATEERIETPTGTVTLLKANGPKLLADVHVFGDEIRAAMAFFDPSIFADAAPAPVAVAEESLGSSCANFPEEMVAEMMNCELCKIYIENPQMMTVAKTDIVFLKNGMAMTSAVQNAEKIKAFHTFEKKFHAKLDGLKKLSREEAQDKICGLCKQFKDLEHSGATIDWNLTSNGSLTVMTASDPKVVKKIHELGQVLKSFESKAM